MTNTNQLLPLARLGEGRTFASLGPLPERLGLPQGVAILRVRCGADQRPLGAWRELSARAARLMGEPDPERNNAQSSVFKGAPRHRLLGSAGPEAVSSIVGRLQRLAKLSPRGLVLVFDDVDAADDATLALLERLVSAPEVFRVPMLLGTRGARVGEATRAVLEALVARQGADAIVTSAPSPSTPPPSEPSWRDVVARLDGEALLTLRAASVVGSTFDVGVVAELREISVVNALEHLQRAGDAGVPFDDAGDGRLRMPPTLCEFVRASVLPSLGTTWHRRVADQLGRRPEGVPVAPTRTTRPRAEAPAPAHVPAPALDDPPVRKEPPREGHHHVAHVPAPRVSPPPVVEELFPPAQNTRGGPRLPVEAPTPAESVTHVVKAPPELRAGADSVKAAQHLAAIGDVDGAARELFAATREAAAIGLPVQALAHGKDALAMLAGLPVSNARRLLRVEGLVAMGTIRWHASGPGTDFSLRSAYDTLLEARGALRDGDPPALRGATAAAFAGVAGDLGDVTALDLALSELSEATRVLMAEGATVEAARLLNDQAALLLRVGDPVKAAWLLDRSRAVFERAVDAMGAEGASADPWPLAELAETEHLYARLPLHAAARPGREAEALSMGREHGLAALEVYRRLGEDREVGRVLDTLAQLELRAGHLRHAEERLQEAIRLQEAQGDVLGLARSEGTLAEVCASSGRLTEASQRLSDSLTFNVEKGSALGVAWNRLAYERIGKLSRSAGDDEARRSFDALGGQVARAEEIVGRVRLPSDAV